MRRPREPDGRNQSSTMCRRSTLGCIVLRPTNLKMETTTTTTASLSYADLAKSLHQKTIDLDKHMRNLSTINDELKEKCEKALNALHGLCGTNSIASRITCGICYTRERTHAIMPCGHAGLCETCSSRVVRRGRCPTCRQAVESSVRIYL